MYFCEIKYRKLCLYFIDKKRLEMFMFKTLSYTKMSIKRTIVYKYINSLKMNLKIM